MPSHFTPEERAKLGPLLSKNPWHGKIHPPPVMAVELARFLRVQVVHIHRLARRMECLRRRRPHDSTAPEFWVTWRGAEKIILIVREQQGAKELLKLERRRKFSLHASPPHPREP